MDENAEFMTYLEYKAHCYKHHKKPLSRNIAGPVVYKNQQIKYATSEPRTDLKEIFDFLSGSDNYISRMSVEKALEKVRVPLKGHLKLFDLIGSELIDLETFYRIFA